MYFSSQSFILSRKISCYRLLRIRVESSGIYSTLKIAGEKMVHRKHNNMAPIMYDFLLGGILPYKPIY